MYLIFNKYGHYEMTIPEQPQSLIAGYFMLEGDRLDKTYAYSDGKQIWQTDTPPPSQYHKFDGEKWIISSENQSLILADSKAAKLHLLNDTAQAVINKAAGIDKVPEFELASWPIQAQEAKAWSSNKSAYTPVLDQIAASRGVSPDTLKNAALRKTLSYEKLTAHVAGQRQALQSKIEAAKTAAALDKIVIKFTTPEGA